MWFKWGKAGLEAVTIWFFGIPLDYLNAPIFSIAPSEERKLSWRAVVKIVKLVFLWIECHLGLENALLNWMGLFFIHDLLVALGMSFCLASMTILWDKVVFVRCGSQNRQLLILSIATYTHWSYWMTYSCLYFLGKAKKAVSLNWGCQHNKGTL